MLCKVFASSELHCLMTLLPTRGYNELKRLTLALFESYDWLRPPDWAHRTRFQPKRASYSYLKRLCRWGLLQRRWDAGGFLVYGLSDRGRERLAWLRRVQR